MIFKIREASGKVHENIHVTGCTGPAGVETLRIEIRRANEGKPLTIHEPKPGHVEVYGEDNGKRESYVAIDLRGAILLEYRHGLHAVKSIG